MAKIKGTNKSDALYGTNNSDLIFGAAGNDSLFGKYGKDTLYGEAGHDTLFGGGDNDVLYGGDGNDTLFGGSGDDILYGGDGADRLEGGAGDDTLIAGHGDADTDVFVFDDNWGSDIVKDYLPGTDQFDVSQVDGLDSFDDFTVTLITAPNPVRPGTEKVVATELRYEDDVITIQSTGAVDADDFIF